MRRSSRRDAGVVVLLVCALLGFSANAALPFSSLAVFREGRWITWWRSDDAPSRWAAPDTTVAGALQWQRLQPGLELAKLRLAGSGEAWRVGVVVVRIEPAAFDLTLTGKPRSIGGEGPWTIADAPVSAAIAFNAGQFRDVVPWGWIVRQHRERKPPGRGPLAFAVVLSDDDRVAIVPPDSIDALRARALPREAFQSYPALLVNDGEIPVALQDSGLGIDVAHRDARLALGTLRDGRTLVALTRFEGLGGMLQHLPFGVTAPEMSAIMGALGAQHAVMLDGGISAQLLVRDSLGQPMAWSGLRRVPLGMIGIPRRQTR
jgi:hypothetical protein